jgi:hypothetical protein
MQCNLCDTIQVIFPDYNASGTYKIVKTVWDVLSDRYDEMELGELSTTLAQALGVGGGSLGGGGGSQPVEPDDYIVDQGTDNSWTYRKWNSGVFEAWRYYQATGLTLTTSSMGTYYGTSKSIALPSFTLTITCSTYGDTVGHGSGIYIYQTQKSGDNLQIDYRAHASSTSGQCGGFFHIFGTWK